MLREEEKLNLKGYAEEGNYIGVEDLYLGKCGSAMHNMLTMKSSLASTC